MKRLKFDYFNYFNKKHDEIPTSFPASHSPNIKADTTGAENEVNDNTSLKIEIFPKSVDENLSNLYIDFALKIVVMRCEIK